MKETTYRLLYNPPKKAPHGMSDTPTKNIITLNNADIPRPIRNILHHNPQASLQVGLTSLFIYSSSFLFIFVYNKGQLLCRVRIGLPQHFFSHHDSLLPPPTPPRVKAAQISTTEILPCNPKIAASILSQSLHQHCNYSCLQMSI